MALNDVKIWDGSQYVSIAKLSLPILGPSVQGSDGPARLSADLQKMAMESPTAKGAAKPSSQIEANLNGAILSSFGGGSIRVSEDGVQIHKEAGQAVTVNGYDLPAVPGGPGQYLRVSEDNQLKTEWYSMPAGDWFGEFRSLSGLHSMDAGGTWHTIISKLEETIPLVTVRGSTQYLGGNTFNSGGQPQETSMGDLVFIEGLPFEMTTSFHTDVYENFQPIIHARFVSLADPALPTDSSILPPRITGIPMEGNIIGFIVDRWPAYPAYENRLLSVGMIDTLFQTQANTAIIFEMTFYPTNYP